jgi:hypothetical protein
MDQPEYAIDLPADLANEEDDGLNWSLVEKAAHPETVVPGAVLRAGRVGHWSWVEIMSVDPDGQVHFRQIAAPEHRGAT